MAGEAPARRPKILLSDELSNPPQSSSKRGLNLNAPLLSVRRRESGDICPANFVKKANDFNASKDTEGNSGKASSHVMQESLRSPGTVPFRWEQSPGRPKANGNTASAAETHSLIAPRLPPCRAASPLHSAVLHAHDQSSPIHNGKAKDNTTSVIRKGCRPAGSDCPLPLYPRKANGAEEKMPSLRDQWKRSDSCASTATGDDIFSDAAETFANTDRTSCLGGRDSAGVPAKQTDPSARDFIMRRFLPAAQAMVSEVPASLLPEKCVLKKPEQQMLPLKNPSRQVAYRMFQQRLVDGKVDNEDDNVDISGELSSKACGMFGSFRLGAALRHLLSQPIGGTKVKRNVGSVTNRASKKERDRSRFSKDLIRTTSNKEELLEITSSEEEEAYHDLEEANCSTISQLNGSRLSLSFPQTRNMVSAGQQPLQRDHLETSVSHGSQLADESRFQYHTHKLEGRGFLGFPYSNFTSSLSSREELSSMEYADSERELTKQDGATSVESHNRVVIGHSDESLIFGLKSDYKAPEDYEADGGVHSTDCEHLMISTGNRCHTSDSCRIVRDITILAEVKQEQWLVEKSADQGWPLRLTKTVRSGVSAGNMDEKLFEKSQEVPASSSKSVEADVTRLKKVRWQDEQLMMKPKPVRPPLPPLPKSPAQPWQWRSVLKSASPSSSPLIAHIPQRIYSKIHPPTNTGMEDGASWESLVKSASVQTSHLRYSNELFNKTSAMDVLHVFPQNST